jgi:hypothetical protein
MDDSLDSTNTDSNAMTQLKLDLRGSRFVIERETLMNLPESVLLCLFPNGLVLSRQAGGYEGISAGEEGEEEEEEVYMVDVSGALEDVKTCAGAPTDKSLLLPVLSIVRPAMSLLRPFLFPESPRRLLRNPYAARKVPRASTL